MDTTDYNFGDKLLHRLALGVPMISRASFEFDDFLPAETSDHLDERHVFISGLARAGTTILMRTFHNTGQFRSLTYRDMPFVLMPGIWRKFSAPFYRHKEPKVRAHGDGIYVNFDSPEAFEEVFWRVFSGDEYILDECLRPYRVSKELIEQFRLYVRRIVASASDHNHTRYLSKNNNNILRIGAIRKAFPASLILIPFRSPISHAISLLNQHQQFCDRHAIDKFSRDYMLWLGHYEFGMTHKPFRFDKGIVSSGSKYNADHVNYWLGIWIATYSYLLNIAPSESIFVCFEDLCESPVETITSLFKSADILLNTDKFKVEFNSPALEDAGGIDENLRSQAQEIYLQLRTVAIARIGNTNNRNDDKS